MDLDILSNDLLQVMEEMLQLAHIRLWLWEPQPVAHGENA
jgi:hypothetical protein